MRVVVHHGMTKAGSTALQRGLSEARAPLLEQGVLFPAAPIASNNHDVLLAGLLPPGELPRYVRHRLEKQAGGAAAGAELVARWLGEVGEAAARGRVRMLLLSAENLWCLRSAAAGLKLREALRGLGAERIETLAYLRRPSDWYLSTVQQVLKASHEIRAAGPVPYRAPIEAAEAVADPGAARLVVYDRDAFPGGDVLAHFRDAVLGGIELPPPTRPREANATFSAEGMDLLQSYRRHVHPDGRDVFTPDTRRLRRAIGRADRLVPGADRPVLHPALRARIDAGSGDLAWLRDARGIVFPGLEEVEADAGDWHLPLARVDEVCAVDPARREALAMRILSGLGEGTGGAGGRRAERRRRRRRRKRKKADDGA